MKQPIWETNARFLLSRCAKKMTACVLSAVLLLACCPLALAAEHDPDPLTAQELARMTDEEIAALSRQQSDATLNKMAQLFQDGEKQELNEYLSALGFATTYAEYAQQQGWDEDEDDAEPSIQPMWQSDYDGKEPDKQCHETMTGYGFLMYIGAMNQLFGIAGSFGYTITEMQLLMTESAWPDKDLLSVITLFAGHFYDPDTGLNFMNSNATTARNNAYGNYNQAVTYFREGNRSEAIKSLAHAIHYIQDVGVPHHAANYTAGLTNHSDFEALASQILLSDDYVDSLNGLEYSADFYTGITSDMGYFAHEIASTTKPTISIAADRDNIVGQQLLIRILLVFSMRNTSGVLYRFAKDVGLI